MPGTDQYQNNPTTPANSTNTQENMMANATSPTEDVTIENTFAPGEPLKIVVAGPGGAKITWEPGEHFATHLRETDGLSTDDELRQYYAGLGEVNAITLESILFILEHSMCAPGMLPVIHRTIKDAIDGLLQTEMDPAAAIQQLLSGLGSGASVVAIGPDTLSDLLGGGAGARQFGDESPAAPSYGDGAQGGYL